VSGAQRDLAATRAALAAWLAKALPDARDVEVGQLSAPGATGFSNETLFFDLAYTAAGVYDGFFELRLAPWDFAAGVLLVREAGGRITDLDGGDAFFDSGNLIAGPPELHAELLATVHAIVDEARMEAVDPVRNKSHVQFVET